MNELTQDKSGERSVNIFLALAGPSGVGKATLTRVLLERHPEIVRLTTYTTRKPRPDEVPGDQYFFVDRDTFLAMYHRGELMESSPVYQDGNLYGMPNNILNQVPPGKEMALVEVDMAGIKFLKTRYPDCITILVVAPLDELAQRIALREPGMGEDEYQKRLTSATKWLQKAPSFDYIIENEQGALEKALQKIEAIITAEMSRPQRFTRRHPTLAALWK